MIKTCTEEFDEPSYAVEFMTVVADKADNLRIVDSDSHFSGFAGVHPSKIKQGKLFLYDILKPADRERVMQAICKKNTRFVYIDMDLMDCRSNPVFVHCTAQNYEDSTLCRMTFADVSKSLEKQAALQARATEMDRLIDLVNGGVCLFKVSPDMHIEVIYLNQGCCRLFGTSKESCRERAYRLDELIHPDDRSAVFQAIGKTMAINEPLDVECRVRVHKDEFIWCKMNAGIQRYDREDCPVFHAIFTDITRIKAAEKKADDESERLVRLFKNLPGAIFTTDSAEPLKLDLVSEDFIRFIGYSRTELFDIFGGKLDRFMLPEEIAAVRRQLCAGAEHQETVTATYTLQSGSAGEIRVCDSRKIILNADGSKSMAGILRAI